MYLALQALVVMLKDWIIWVNVLVVSYFTTSTLLIGQKSFVFGSYVRPETMQAPSWQNKKHSKNITIKRKWLKPSFLIWANLRRKAKKKYICIHEFLSPASQLQDEAGTI